MGIQEIKVEGFRSLRDVHWTPGQLNVVIGENGSGKSNLLYALQLLQDSAAGRLSTEILDQGGIGQILWDSREGGELSWAVRTEDLRYELALRRIGTTSSYRIEHELLDDGSHRLIERDAKEATMREPEKNTVRVHYDTYPEEESLLSSATVPTGRLDASSFRKDLLSWGIFYDIRVDRSSLIRQAAVSRFEKQIKADGQNLVPVLHTLYTGDRSFKKELDLVMRAAFGTSYEELTFPPAGNQRIELRLRWRALETEQSSANLSDGTLRFLLLIAILANPEPGALVAIDEPETGLHPRMFPIIAELAAEASTRAQIIFTTHSPQFLDAFSEQAPTTTVAECEEGETRLSIVDGEDLRRFLAHYSLGELFVSGNLAALT
ncbi:MAG: chromosome segregation protein SMC [Acidobacteria bacterium]|nr:MAG: chromosome segregation protein SMC [Acidobacteriota bacterium]